MKRGKKQVHFSYNFMLFHNQMIYISNYDVFPLLLGLKSFLWKITEQKFDTS